MHVVHTVLLLNGLYDLVCAVSILCYPESHGLVHVLSRIHLGMYTDAEHHGVSVFRRMLAYWILTYGCLRIFSGLSGSTAAGCLTYFLEAFCLFYEHQAGGTLKLHAVCFVCGLCLCMGLCIIFFSAGT